MILRLVFILPRLDAGDEFLPFEIGAFFAFLGQDPFFDDRLRGDARVVRARHPERIEALHPVIADEDILKRIVQGVAQVQRGGNIRRGYDDGVGFSFCAVAVRRGNNCPQPRSCPPAVRCSSDRKPCSSSSAI